MEARTAATYPTAAAAAIAATAAAIAATAAATLPGEQRRRSSEAAAHRERSPALENMRRLTAAAKALGPLLPRRFYRRLTAAAKAFKGFYKAL